MDYAVGEWARATEAELYARRGRLPGLKPNLRRRRGRIAVVTDSSCSLPVDRLGQLGMNITSVPIPVMVETAQHDAQIYSEESEELDRDLPLAVAQGTPVRTSRPSPGRLAEAYREIAAQGYAGIVSIHLSGKLSGTVEAAQLAAQDSRIPVVVVDSGQAGLSLGHAVLDAAMTAQLGGSLAEVADAAERTVEASESLFVVPNLEQLRRGGRINALAGIVGNLLWVKPLLHIRDGEVQPLERPRTLPRAIARLTQRVTEAAEKMERPRIVVHGFGNPGQARELAESLQEHSALPVPVVPLPPALGAHLGLGALAVCVSPAAD